MLNYQRVDLIGPFGMWHPPWSVQPRIGCLPMWFRPPAWWKELPCWPLRACPMSCWRRCRRQCLGGTTRKGAENWGFGNIKWGECSQKYPKNGRVKFTKAKCVFQCISCFCHRGLGDVWTVYRDCQPCGSMHCLFLRHIKWECGQQTWRLYQQ